MRIKFELRTRRGALASRLRMIRRVIVLLVGAITALLLAISGVSFGEMAASAAPAKGGVHGVVKPHRTKPINATKVPHVARQAVSAAARRGLESERRLAKQPIRWPSAQEVSTESAPLAESSTATQQASPTATATPSSRTSTTPAGRDGYSAESAVTPAASPAATAAATPTAPASQPTGTATTAASRINQTRTAPGPITLSTAPNDAPATVRVLDHADAARAGITGVVLQPITSAAVTKSSGPVTVAIDYSGFARAYGGDWGGRLQLWSYPACRITTPQVQACNIGTTLPATNRSETQTLTGRVAASTSRSSSRVMVAQASSASSTGTGDYAATTLSQSASWTAGGPSGAFNWAYDIDPTPSRGDLEPTVRMDYSSQVPDGRTATTNNQASWVGEGFDIASSYIERGYATCKDDGQAGKYDLCWKTDNATLVLNGQANELILQTRSGTSSWWRLKHDDGTRVRRYTTSGNGNSDNDGETWQVTTPDGTSYTFGQSTINGQATSSVWTVPASGDDPGEPCYNANGFGSSFCTQGWRWNLDSVTDLDGNSMSYWYNAESNRYAKNGLTSSPAAYVPGGRLLRIDYGMRAADTTPSNRVTFTSIGRCKTATLANPTPTCAANATNFPDVPTDQLCSASATSCSGKAPTFYTGWRLAQVTTSILRSGTLAKVGQWTINTTYKTIGSASPSVLWPEQIQQVQTAADGTAVTLPPVKFRAQEMENRIDTARDGLSPLVRWRLGSITSETGAETTISYSGQDCTPDSVPADAEKNIRRCFPQKWAPPSSPTRTDWFHKYVVTRVVTNDPSGASDDMTTSYDYPDRLDMSQKGAAWVKNDDQLIPDSYQTYSQWRGYDQVTTTRGTTGTTDTPSQTVQRYLRGVPGGSVTDSKGKTYTDSPQYAGFQVESQSKLSPGGPDLSTTIDAPWSTMTAAGTRNSAEHQAFYVNDGASTTYQATAAGGTRKRTITNTYDAASGLPVRVSDDGDLAVSDDQTCTTTSYASTRPETGTWILGLPATVVSSTGVCAAGSATPAKDTLLSATQTSYDGGAVGAAPTRGLVTKQERLDVFDGATPHWQTTETNTYDSYGRTTRTDTLGDNDALIPITTAYTDSSDRNLVKTSATTTANGKSYTVTTDLDPTFGQPTVTTDPNGNITRRKYDAMGRVTDIWLPGRASTDSATYQYAYTVSATAPSTVKSSQLNFDGSARNDSYVLYDAQLRPRQTQSPTLATGQSVVTNTFYDGRGLVSDSQEDILVGNFAPSTALLSVPQGSVPHLTKNTYDGAGRLTRADLIVYNSPEWATTTSYGGAETTLVTPPAGAPPTAASTDIRGRVVTRIEKGSSDARDLTSSYTYDLQDNLTKLDGPGGTWKYGYDLLGRQTSAKDPDAGITASTYTSGDKVATSTDARGTTLTHRYDDLGRPTGLYNGTAETGHELTTWLYDDNKGAVVTNGVGQLISTTRYAPDGTTFTDAVTAYSSRYKPTKTKFTITNPTGGGIGSGFSANGYSYSTSYTSDLEHVASATSPTIGSLGPEVLQYGYNRLSQVLYANGRANNVFLGAHYDELGRLGDITFGPTAQRTETTLGYTAGTRRLQSQTVYRPSTNSQLAAQTYNYDDAGNMTSSVDTAAGAAETQCFNYDDHARLQGAWTPAAGGCATAPDASSLGGPAPYWQSWTYDTQGRRATQTSTIGAGAQTATTTYAYPASGAAHTNTLATVSTSQGGVTSTGSYAYDDAGNTTSLPAAATRSAPAASQPGAPQATAASDSTQALTWSPENKVASITPAGQPQAKTNFFYGADGEVLLKDSPTEKVLYLANGDEAHLDKSTAAVTGVRSYTSPMGTIATRRDDNAISWQIPNPQNTSSIAINSATQNVSRRWFTPFGQDRTPAGSGGGIWPTDHAFLDKPADTNTGLTDVGARQYDTSTGLFLSVDPLFDTADPTSQLGYTYAGNNPTTNSDPTGLMYDSYGCQCTGSSSSKPKPHNGGGGGGKATPHSSSNASMGKPLTYNYYAYLGGSNRPIGNRGYVTDQRKLSCDDAVCHAVSKAVTVIARVALYDERPCDRNPNSASCNFEVGRAGATIMTAGFGGLALRGGGLAANGGRAVVDASKYDYLFGKVASNAHNAARSTQNARQLVRIGVHDNAAGRSLLSKHFDDVVARNNNIAKTYADEHGTFQIRDSLFSGPGGFLKFESTWQVTDDGLRLTTLIPKGGP